MRIVFVLYYIIIAFGIAGQFDYEDQINPHQHINILAAFDASLTNQRSNSLTDFQ